MHLIITLEASEEIYTLEVSSSMTLADLRAFIEAESGIAVDKQTLFYKTAILEEEDKTLSEFSMEDYDMVMLRARTQESNESSQNVHGELTAADQNAIMNDVEKVRLQMLGDQALCDLVRQVCSIL
ncbi:hypothetical protein V1511DRAFT_72391 [Dipodascopsis uninucleata]